MYKLYTRWQDGGWDGPSCYDNLEDIQKIISNSKCSYMIIKNENNRTNTNQQSLLLAQ